MNVEISERFKEIADRNVWSAYHGDEIPLSADKPMTLAQAQAVAAEQGVAGVGIVMTGDLRLRHCGDFLFTLICADFTGVNFDKFKLPLAAYCERSPSGGARVFHWAPISWAEKFVDSPDVKVPHCERAGFYFGDAPYGTAPFGTSAKFFAVTGNSLEGMSSRWNSLGHNIAQQWQYDLARLKGWNKAETVILEEAYQNFARATNRYYADVVDATRAKGVTP